MGQIGEAISTSVPAVGTAGTTYASDINTLLTEFKTRLTQKLRLSSIDGTLTTDSSIDMNNQPVQNASYLGLYPQSAAPSGIPNGRLASYAGNLYYVDTAGAVQITSGASLNASGIGGIVGDYGGANPAKVSFVDASERYEFYDDMSATQWAIAKFRQWEAVDETSGRVVTVIPPTAIAANYTLSLPPNDPAAGVSLLTLNNTGLMQLAESAPVTNAFSIGAVATFTVDPVLSGATKIKHGNRTRQSMLTVERTAGTAIVISEAGYAGASDTEAISRLQLQVGERIQSVTVRVNKSSTGTFTATLKSVDSSGTVAAVAGATANSSASGLVTLTLTPAAPPTVASGTRYHVYMDWGNTDTVYNIEVTYDVP